MATEVVGPFTDLVQRSAQVIWQVAADNVPKDLQWQYIALTVVLATFIWWKRGGRGAKGADGRERQSGLLEFLLPRDIYTHVSALRW